jgi:pyroglutamyl-peptidase
MPTLPHLLVTGFEPFGGLAANPSGEAARSLHGQIVGGHRVVGVELPCGFDRAPPALQQALVAWQPAAVLCLGLAASRTGFSPERVAINLIDARIADNDGAQPLDRPVIDGAPAAHFGSLPVKAIVAALLAAGHEAEVSYSAGTFVCNQVFFHLMDALAARPGVRGGFMHVGGDLDAVRVADGALIALQTIGAQAEDLALVGGRVD